MISGFHPCVTVTIGVCGNIGPIAARYGVFSSHLILLISFSIHLDAPDSV